MLILRLSPLALHFARYTAGAEDAFRFATLDISTMPSVGAALRRAKQEVALLHDAESRLEVLAVGPTTLLPLADFAEEQIYDVYRKCFPETEDVRVFYDTIANVGAVLIFGVDEHTCQTLESLYPRVHYRSAHSAILARAAEQAKQGITAGHRFSIHLHEQTADVMAFRDGRLVADNTFHTPTAQDVAYYTLGMAQQLHANLADTPFCLTGEAPLRDASHEALAKFVARPYTLHASSQYNRHIVSTTDGVPYDMVVALLS